VIADKILPYLVDLFVGAGADGDGDNFSLSGMTTNVSIAYLGRFSQSTNLIVGAVVGTSVVSAIIASLGGASVVDGCVCRGEVGKVSLICVIYGAAAWTNASERM
jgi:hypothetical protein